jgi:hypothetical protein
VSNEAFPWCASSGMEIANKPNTTSGTIPAFFLIVLSVSRRDHIATHLSVSTRKGLRSNGSTLIRDHPNGTTIAKQACRMDWIATPIYARVSTSVGPKVGPFSQDPVLLPYSLSRFAPEFTALGAGSLSGNTSQWSGADHPRISCAAPRPAVFEPGIVGHTVHRASRHLRM